MPEQRRSESAWPAVLDLVDAWELDARVPVDIISRMNRDGWIVRVALHSLAPLIGYAVLTKDVRLVRVDAALPSAWRRVVHARACIAPLHGRFGFVPMSRDTATNPHVARLLIPDWILTQATAVDDIARACDVPPQLVISRLIALEEWSIPCRLLPALQTLTMTPPNSSNASPNCCLPVNTWPVCMTWPDPEPDPLASPTGA